MVTKRLRCLRKMNMSNSKILKEKFSKPFKSYLGEDALYNLINNMIEEIKCCSNVMKKHFNRELAMT